MVADDTEGEGHSLQRVDGVLVGHVVAGEDDPDPKHIVKVMLSLSLFIINSLCKISNFLM